MTFPELESTHAAVTKHPLLSRALDTREARVFMEHDVFAVWAFVSLRERLERELAGERSSLDVRFTAVSEASQVDRYVDAMRARGADTAPIEQLLVRIGLGDDPFAALGCAPEAAERFAAHVLRLALDPRTPTVAIAAAFLQGGEPVLPAVFRPLVDVARAEALLAEQCAEPTLAAIAEEAARDALVARKQLWDGVLAALPHRISSSTTFLSDSRLLTVSTRSHDGA